MPGILTWRGFSEPRSATPLHLHDDDAAGIVRGHRDRQCLQRQCFLLHRDVAVGVGRGAADDADVDREGLVHQVILAADVDQRDEVFLRAVVDLAAAVARSTKVPRPTREICARLAAGDVAEEVGDDALRQVVALDLVLHRELLQLRYQPPVAPTTRLTSPSWPSGLRPRSFIALPGGVEEGEVLRRAFSASGRHRKTLLQRDGDVLGEADADETAGGNGCRRRGRDGRLQRRRQPCCVSRSCVADFPAGGAKRWAWSRSPRCCACLPGSSAVQGARSFVNSAMPYEM